MSALLTIEEEEDVGAIVVDRVKIAREHQLAIQEEEDTTMPSWMRYLPTTSRNWSKKQKASQEAAAQQVAGGGGGGEEEGDGEEGGVKHVEVEERLSSNPFAVSIKSLRAAAAASSSSNRYNNNYNHNNQVGGGRGRGRGRTPKISASLRSSPYGTYACTSSSQASSASSSSSSSSSAIKKRINVEETALLLSTFSCS